MSAINGVVAKDEVLIRTEVLAFLSCAGLHAEPVVAAVQTAIDDEDDLRVADVHSIAVLCPPGAGDGDVIDDEVEEALLAKARSGDVTAMIFWLKNRRYNVWRDKQTQDINLNTPVIFEGEDEIRD